MLQVCIALGCLLQILATNAWIVPDIISDIIFVTYSGIPIIKKGTDSRFGWGFNLGDRADFQVLVEMGPQKNTQPIRTIPDPLGASKRNVPNSLRNILYAQQQRNKQIFNTDVGRWVNQLMQTMQKNLEATALPKRVKPGLALGEIDAKSVTATLMPQELYKSRAKEEPKVEVTTPQAKTTTSAKNALDNVDLE